MCLGKSPLLFVIDNKGDFLHWLFFYSFCYQLANLGGIESIVLERTSINRIIKI